MHKCIVALNKQAHRMKVTALKQASFLEYLVKNDEARQPDDLETSTAAESMRKHLFRDVYITKSQYTWDIWTFSRYS